MSSGAVKPRVMCRLSPNEEAALLRQHREDRRKARLLEVREQERSFAKKVRDNVRTKKKEERRAIEEHLQAVLAASQEAELRELEAHYQARRKQIGQGHREAQHVTQEENRLQEERFHLKAEQRWQAKQRHNVAMKELSMNQLREQEEAQHPLVVRKRALAVEKERAKHIAIHKPHPTQPLIKDLAVGRGHKVQLKEAEGFASTYYNIPSTIVQRVAVHHQGKPSAQEMAEATTKQDESFIRHSSVAQQEQQEKAWLRHKHALAKVRLEREKTDVMTQLRALEREDRVHRQKSLAKMPANMFQHTERRVELGCEQQRDMEQAFEGLFIKTHGVHSHPTLSHIGSTSSRQDGSPSPSDASHSTTTQDSSSLSEAQHAPTDKSPSRQHHLDKPSSAQTNHSKYGAGHEESHPRSQQPLAQAQGGKGDPSALSITMLSSDYSSFQQKASVLKPPPPLPKASQPTNFPPRASPGGAVNIPTGEMEPSEESLESSVTTASEDNAEASSRSPPLFQRVAPPGPTCAASTTTAPAQPPRIADVSISDMTESDVRDLTSTTSKSTSSAGGKDSNSDASASGGGGVGGSLQPPIKGILKHPAERRTQSSSVVAPSAPTRRGEGVHKLVSMIRAQHQAWSERLAARASLLQSTLSQMEEDTAPTSSFPTPLAHQSEAGGTQHSCPTPPTRQHDQEEERALHTHPSLSAQQSVSGALHQTHEHIQEERSATHTYPSLSSHQDRGGASYRHSEPSSPSHMHTQEEERLATHTYPNLSSHQDRGGALYQHSHPSPPSHMQIQDDDGALNQHQQRAPLSHDQVGGGAKLNYPLGQHGERVLNMPPSLLFRDQSGTGVNENGSTVIPPNTSHQDSLSIFTLSTRDSTRSPEPNPSHGWTLESTERGAPAPEALSITQYHTTMDSIEPTAHPSAIQHPSSQGDPVAGLRSSHPLPPPSSFAAEYKIASPDRNRELLAELDALASERAEPPFPPADVRVQPPDTGATFSPSLESMPLPALHSSSAPTSVPVPNTASLAPTMANMLGTSGAQYTPVTSLPHPLSPSFSPWSATVPSHPSTSVPLPFQTSNSPFTLPSTAHPYSLDHLGSHVHPTVGQPSDPLPPQTAQPLGSPFDSLLPHTSLPLSSPLAGLQVPLDLSGTPVSTATAISAIPTPTAALHYPLSSGHFPPRSANDISIPADFHQLSFATPLFHVVQDTTAGSPATPMSTHDHSLHIDDVNETSFELEIPHPHTQQLGSPGQYHSEASPELASTLRMLQPPTSYGASDATTVQRLETANADVPVLTQPSAEQLSIVTLETSHAYSEQPINAPSPSPSSHSSSPDKDQEAEEHCTPSSPQSQEDSCSSDSDSSSCEEEKEGVDNINPEASLSKDEEERSKPELEGGVMNAIQLHHLPLTPTGNNDGMHEETESSDGEFEKGVEALSELKQHHKGPPDTDSSEDSDSSSSSSYHEQFMPQPEQSPKSIEPEDRDDTQPHSTSLEDSSSDSSQLHVDVPWGSASPLSLQEAFLRRKEQFILKSKHRLEQLRENAQRRQAESSPLLAHSTPTPLQHTLHVYQGGRGHGHMTSGHAEQGSKAKQRDVDVRRRAVTFSSPLANLQDTGTFSPPKFLGAVSTSSNKPPKFFSSQKREKIRRKEIKERNLRFYNKLPEVKKQREEEQRKKAYSTNRDKAKEYQEKLRIKVKKQGEKKHANSSQPATKAQTQPKLKRPPFR